MNKPRSVKEKIQDRMFNKIWIQVWDQVDDMTWHTVGILIDISVSGWVEDSLRVSVEQQLRDSIKNGQT